MATDEENTFAGHSLSEVESWLRQYWPETPFEALDVPEDASDNLIRKAYMAKARLHCQAFVSDDAKAKEMMTKINSAYEILRDEDTKRVYLQEASTYKPTSKEACAGVSTTDPIEEVDNEVEPAIITTLAQLYIQLDEVIAAGFDADAYVTAHPYFYRSFFGFTFNGAHMAYAFNWPGFVFYTNRGTLLQKLLNIILLAADGVGSVIATEVICIILGFLAFSLLYCTYRRRGAQGKADPAHQLPYYRCVLYPVEFILLCITLHNATMAGASGNLLAVIGIMNFWSCILLTVTNYQLVKSNDIKEVQEVVRKFTGNPNAELHETVTDLFLLIDSTVNGVMNRIVVCLSSFLVLVAVGIAAVYDLFAIIGKLLSSNKKDERTEEYCKTFVVLFAMISYVAACSHYMADCRVECSTKRTDAAAGNGVGSAKLYLYHEQVFYHRQLLFWGRAWLVYRDMRRLFCPCCLSSEEKVAYKFAWFKKTSAVSPETEVDATKTCHGDVESQMSKEPIHLEKEDEMTNKCSVDAQSQSSKAKEPQSQKQGDDEQGPQMEQHGASSTQVGKTYISEQSRQGDQEEQEGKEGENTATGGHINDLD